jgi:ABC-2 type transport system permease protein
MTVQIPAIAPVRDTGASITADLRGVSVVWRRELIRFSRDRTRIVTSFIQPVVFLFLLGTGLSTIARPTAGISYRTFIFPGIMAMSVLFTSVFSAMSIVWDREFGFLREMLVSPEARWTIALGKCLGGMTVATGQGVVFLCLAGAVGVPYEPAMFFGAIAILALMAFATTAFGVLLASRVQRMESFSVVTQFFLMPMFFLSGALFPLAGLPAWMIVLTKLDPVTYAVAPLRHLVFEHLRMNPAQLAALTGITWGRWQLVPLVDVAVLGGFAIAFLSGAILSFSRE